MRRIFDGSLPGKHDGAVDRATLDAARVIVDDVRARGDVALREYGQRFGDIGDDVMVLDKGVLEAAFVGLPDSQRQLLERVAQRIRTFAEAQRNALRDIVVAIPGGQAGHTVAAVQRAGCYAPGGRFPLPSSVLMTAVTARTAGVESVWVASPKPSPVTLAAAWVAGADSFLAMGGAQAIAAFAYGTPSIPRCDVIVGPGNRWVTAAKQLVAGQIGIDMLAGPSELVVLADASADPALIAADLLAQAEHDPDAIPTVVTTDAALADAIDQALLEQLQRLPSPNRETAEASCTNNGAIIVTADLDAAIDACNRLAPEHLELMVADPWAVAPRLHHYGALFVGAGAAEVLGDYGAGPNHVLPTGGTARHSGGLSVLTFLRVRTWLEITDPAAARDLAQDATDLARLEGLEGHARAAERRA